MKKIKAGWSWFTELIVFIFVSLAFLYILPTCLVSSHYRSQETQPLYASLFAQQMLEKHRIKTTSVPSTTTSTTSTVPTTTSTSTTSNTTTTTSTSSTFTTTSTSTTSTTF